jgi:nickel transport protein
MEQPSRPLARSLTDALTCTALAAAALTLGVISSAAPVRAHAIESSLDRVTALNDELLLESRFGSGQPADDAVVRLLPPGGEPIEVGRTDAEGRLRFRLPADAGSTWEVQVDRGPGHRDYLELPGAEAPTSGPALSRAVQGSLSNPAGVSGWLLGLSGTAAGMLALRRRR